MSVPSMAAADADQVVVRGPSAADMARAARIHRCVTIAWNAPTEDRIVPSIHEKLAFEETLDPLLHAKWIVEIKSISACLVECRVITAFPKQCRVLAMHQVLGQMSSWCYTHTNNVVAAAGDCLHMICPRHLRSVDAMLLPSGKADGPAQSPHPRVYADLDIGYRTPDMIRYDLHEFFELAPDVATRAVLAIKIYHPREYPYFSGLYAAAVLWRRTGNGTIEVAAAVDFGPSPLPSEELDYFFKKRYTIMLPGVPHGMWQRFAPEESDIAKMTPESWGTNRPKIAIPAGDIVHKYQWPQGMPMPMADLEIDLADVYTAFLHWQI